MIAHLAGPTAWALRLPSALATIAMAAAVGYVVARVASSRAALLAAVVLSTSLMQAVLGRLAIMDALLDLFVTVAILTWFGALRTGGRRWWYAGWVALALGTITKGPVAVVAPLLVLGPWAAWEVVTRGRIVRPTLGRWVLGIAIFAVILAPWTIAVLHAAGPVAFSEMVGHYTIGRYLGTIENQSGPIWYYVPVVVLGFFPWFAFLVPAGIEGWRDARLPQGALARLSLAWAVVPFVFFSLAKTKLPNYIALELPAYAILTAVWFDRVAGRSTRRAALAATAVVPITIGAVGLALAAFSHDNKLTPYFTLLGPALSALGGVLFLGSVVCFVLLLRRRTAGAGPFALGAASVAVMLIISLWGRADRRAVQADPAARGRGRPRAASGRSRRDPGRLGR